MRSGLGGGFQLFQCVQEEQDESENYTSQPSAREHLRINSRYAFAVINEDASGENESRNTITSASSSSNKINKQGKPPSKKNAKKKGKKRQYREA